MKKIILSLMAGMVLFTSCDLLNNDPYDSFTKDNFFTSEANVEMYANAFYAEWTGYGNNSGTGNFYFQWLNDNQVNEIVEPWTFEAGVRGTDATWEACYEEIRRANILLENIDGVPFEKNDDKLYYIALARLYRGWQHFCLVRKFGDCYWVDKSLTTEDDAILYGPRHNRNIVMDNILADLQYAVDSMGTKNADSHTAYNVHVANAIKSQVCLFEGTYAKYHLKDNARAEKYLKETVAASEAIINSGNFALTPGAEGYRANYNSPDLEGNTEMIMYKRYVKNILGHGIISYNQSSTSTKGISKAAFNAYLMKDGSLPTGEDHGILGTEGVDAGKPVIHHLLEARDPRLAQQIDGYLCYSGNPRKRYEGMPGQEGAMDNTSTTGYGCLKFDNPEIPIEDRKSIGSNHTDAPIFWLAEIILNHAEACAELGGNNEAKAIASINMLRERVNMGTYKEQTDPLNVANPDYDIVQVSNLIWEVRRERRVEMMYDKDDRYWSLIRWHELGRLDTKEYPDQVRGAWIAQDWPLDSHVVLDAEGYIRLNVDAFGKDVERIYDKKHYLAPIPTGQSTLNEQIGQNPGW